MFKHSFHLGASFQMTVIIRGNKIDKKSLYSRLAHNGSGGYITGDLPSKGKMNYLYIPLDTLQYTSAKHSIVDLSGIFIYLVVKSW